jgi:hypothetical protein
MGVGQYLCLSFEQCLRNGLVKLSLLGINKNMQFVKLLINTQEKGGG